MPNVEIRGFPIDSSSVEGVVSRVEAVLKRLGLGSKSITDVVPSLARLADGSKRSAPYLRVIVPQKEATILKTLVPALRDALLEMEVEDGFIEHYYCSKNSERFLMSHEKDEVEANVDD